MKMTDRKLPIDVVLLPMKGDTLAAHAFWRLARRSQRVLRHSLARLAMRELQWH